MPKLSAAITRLPPQTQNALIALGAHLAVARVRRKESLRTWAQLIGISVPTLLELESGEPGVSIGVYASALWLIGRNGELARLAEPAADSAARQAALLKSARSSFRWTAPASEDAAVHLAAVDVNPANSSRRLRGLEVAPSVYVPLRSRSSSRALKRKPSKRWDDDEELPPMPPDEFFDD